jgi:hypothetical protein
MGRTICLTRAAWSTHTSQGDASVVDAQSLNVAQAERSPERDHAYLKLADSPPVELEPNVENGAIIYDDGAWFAVPAGTEPLGVFDSYAEAQRALIAHRRAVLGFSAFFAWLLRARANGGA